MSKQRMAVRLNLPALLGMLALASAAGCESDGENGPDERAQIDCNIDASVDPSTGTADAGTTPDGGPTGVDGGLPRARIVGVTALGSGCPNAGSYTATIAPDGQSATVDLAEFVAEVSSDSTVANRFCQLAVDVAAESGTQYQLSRSAVRGHVALDEGVSGVVEVQTYFQGNPTVSDTWRTDLNGPSDDDLVLDAPDATANWSPCGLDRDVNVRFSSRLSNVSASSRNGYLRVEQLQVFNLASRSCP